MTMLRGGAFLLATICACEPSPPAGTSTTAAASSTNTAAASSSATGASAAVPQTSASDSLETASDFDVGHFDHGSGSGVGARALRPLLVPNMRLSATSVTGKLPPEVIQRIIRQSFGRLRKCYETALEADPKRTGRVTTSFTISADGSIKDVAQTSDIADTVLLACFKGEFSKLSFPAPESGVVKVRYPLVLSPPDYTFTIGGKPSLQVAEADLVRALEAAGYKVTGSDVSQPGTAPITLKAEKDGTVFTLTFDPKGTLADQRYLRLKKDAVSLEEGEWFLAVEGGDKKSAEALIDAIRKNVAAK
jgi:hypothetical protein